MAFTVDTLTLIQILPISEHADLYLWDFPNGRSIEEDVEALHTELAKFTTYSNIILLGLSRGGLVAVQYVSKYPDDNACISKVITVAAPLRGTRIAQFIPFDCSAKRDMCINDSNLACPPIPIYHIGIVYDMVVYPITTCFLDETPNDRRYIYTGVYGHHSILCAPEIQTKIIEWVQE